MIVGTGIDIVYLPRFEKIVKKWEDHFLDRVFTPGEKEYCFRRHNPYPPLAARFAAKEAFFKASELRSLPPWHDVEVINSPEGRPSFMLHGDSATTHAKDHIFLSLSHDGDHAIAQVVIDRNI